MKEFFEGIADILEVDVDQVTPELSLADYPWDSLAIISTIALIDELYNQIIDGQSLAKCERVSDIIALIKID